MKYLSNYSRISSSTEVSVGRREEEAVLPIVLAIASLSLYMLFFNLQENIF